jgi:alpha-galactosidase
MVGYAAAQTATAGKPPTGLMGETHTGEAPVPHTGETPVPRAVPRAALPAHYHADDIAGAAAAVAASGRDMVLSLSPGDHASVAMAQHMRGHVAMARISPDFWDTWPELARQFDLCPAWAPYVGRGFWPDADMLPMGMIGLRHVGRAGPDRMTRFTPDEQRLMMTLWAIFRSPLFFGGDMTRLDPATRALLTNPEVLAVNQTSANNRQLFRRGDHVAWIADAICVAGIPLGGSKGLPACAEGASPVWVSPSPAKYLALFNLSDTGPADIAVALDELGLSASARADAVSVRDLWTGEDLGQAVAVLLPVPAHGARLVQISPA